jgi:hypothetical protein
MKPAQPAAAQGSARTICRTVLAGGRPMMHPRAGRSRRSEQHKPADTAAQAAGPSRVCGDLMGFLGALVFARRPSFRGPAAMPAHRRAKVRGPRGR